MRDWEYINATISAKRYDGTYHIRKLNLETANYSYMTLFDHELEDILKIKNVLEEKRQSGATDK